MAFKVKKLTSRQKVVKVYAEHYPQPVSNIKGFNETLRENTGYKTNKREVAKLLNY